MNPMKFNMNTRVRWRALRGLSALSNLSGKRVLDVGCGLGFFSEQFAARGAQVVSTDIDKDALDYVAKTLKVDAQFLDAEQTDFPNGGFDVIYIGEVLEHVKDPLLIFQRAAKALNPGGYFVITTPSLEGWLSLSKGKQLAHDHGGQKHEREGFLAEELTKLTADSGLELLDLHFCLFSTAELFMQLTKLGYLAKKKEYEGQSNALDLMDTLSFRILRLVFPLVWLIVSLEEILGDKLNLNGHCHVLIAKRES